MYVEIRTKKEQQTFVSVFALLWEVRDTVCCLISTINHNRDCFFWVIFGMSNAVVVGGSPKMDQFDMNLLLHLNQGCFFVMGERITKRPRLMSSICIIICG
jgi:hypothetical protein